MKYAYQVYIYDNQKFYSKLYTFSYAAELVRRFNRRYGTRAKLRRVSLDD